METYKKSVRMLVLLGSCSLIGLAGFFGGAVGCGGGGGDEQVTDQSTVEESENKTSTGSIVGVVGTINAAKGMTVGKTIQKAANVDLTALVVGLAGEGEETFETHPDAAGKFSFSNIPAGTYKLNIKPDQEFPMQAYYPEADINVLPDQTIDLSIPIVRGLPLNAGDVDLNSLVINSNNGEILLQDKNGRLFRIVDNGAESEPSIEKFENIYGTYFGKDDEKGFYFTEYISESNMIYDYEWGTSNIGTIHECNIIVYDSSFSEETADLYELGSKNAKLAQSAGWSCGDGKTCYNYNYSDEANCPIDYHVKNGIIYALVELTEDNKKELGVDEGKKLMIISPPSDKVDSYLLDKGVSKIAVNEGGFIYAIDDDKFNIKGIQITDGQAEEVYTVPLYENGIQKDIYYDINPKTGRLYLSYQINAQVGTSALEPWLMVVDSAGTVTMDKRISEVVAGKEQPDTLLDACYNGSYSAVKASGSSGSDYGYGECSAKDKEKIEASIKACIKNGILSAAEAGSEVYFSKDGVAHINGIPFITDDSTFDVVVSDEAYPDFDPIRCDGYGNYMYCADASCNGFWLSDSIMEEKIKIYIDRLYCLKQSSVDPTNKYYYGLGSCSDGSFDGKYLGISRYSADYSDLDVYVGLLFIDQERLLGLDVHPLTGRVYTYDPNTDELLVLE